jgi:3-mercaptopyruvate sulfurtransferase SseA
LYCAHGQEISHGLTATLQAMGADARHLEGGISEWLAKGQAVTSIHTEGESA